MRGTKLKRNWAFGTDDKGRPNESYSDRNRYFSYIDLFNITSRLLYFI